MTRNGIGAMSEARAILDAHVSEAELQREIVRFARLRGWLVYHPWRSDHSERGWPDLAMVHPEQRRFVVAELKREGKHPTAEQRRWIEALAAAGVEVHLWRPSDWSSGLIEEVLR